ncbi:MAG: FliM/FliN family flagellar motor C-terminal domain-containing protein [Acidobacteriota bacterium]
MTQDKKLQKDVPDPGRSSQLDRFQDVEYEIHVSVGSAVVKVAELLKLRVGDRLALDQPASQNVTLTIGGVPLASAEVVRIKRGVGARVVGICK